MKRIGSYIIERFGGKWVVVATGEIQSEHPTFWDALRTARDLNWRDVHEKKKPPVHEQTGGSKEPKSKWRRVI